MKAIPVSFEIEDGDGEPIAEVKAIDTFSAEVTITGCVTPKSWPELSAAIQSALDVMELEE